MTEQINQHQYHEHLLIIGCGGHSKVVSDIAESQGYSNISYLNTFGGDDRFLGREVLHYEPLGYEDAFFVAIGDNRVRQRVTAEFHQNRHQKRRICLQKINLRNLQLKMPKIFVKII